MEFQNPLYISILSIGGFALFWYLIIWVVGTVGGWKTIADRFPDMGSAQMQHAQKHFQSIKVGVSNYSGIVNLSSSSYGLHMSVILPFKPGHPDVLIPWSELEVVDNKGLLGKMYKFSFASLPNKSFFTFNALGEWIASQKRQHSA